MIKELGDVIAKETNTNLCPHHRIIVARALIKWLSEQQTTHEMQLAARQAIDKANGQCERGWGDKFDIKFRAALAELAKEPMTAG